MGKILKKASKVVRKVIPKEIRPALPFIAAYYGGPLLAEKFSMNPAFAKFLTASAASKAQGDDTKAALRSGIFAAAPDVIGAGLEKAGGSEILSNLPKVGEGLTKAGKYLQVTDPGLNKQALGIIGGQTSVEGGIRAAEIAQDELDRYNQQLQDQGIRDKAERRQSIFNIYTGSGYDPEYVNSVLDKYGYAEGGRVEGIMSMSPKVMKGMSLGDLADLAKKIKDAEEAKKRESKRQGGRVGFNMGGGEFSLISVLLDRINPDTGEKYTPEEAEEVVSGMRGVDTSDIMQGIEGIQSGFETAMGEPIFGQRPQPMGIVPGFGNLPRMAEGGLMNLKAGGMPAEMDMRGGGFIPIGRKERADDVPARLSKNEFVMTADAVRGAGGGSIEKGAKRMYQTMKRLEAKS